MGGMVHSFAFNDRHGDYGATLILSHQLDSVSFYTFNANYWYNKAGRRMPGYSLQQEWEEIVAALVTDEPM